MEEKKKPIGLWINISKDGKSYMSGKDEEKGIKYTIFQNSYKEQGSNKPDYQMYLSDLNEEKQKKFSAMGFKKPAPIQEEAPF